MSCNLYMQREDAVCNERMDLTGKQWWKPHSISHHLNNIRGVKLCKLEECAAQNTNTMSSHWKGVKQIEFRKRKMEFTLTVLIILALHLIGKTSHSEKVVWNNYPIYINKTDNNITIEENITDLQCTWSGKSCYIECTSVNITVNISGNLEMSILNHDKDSLYLSLPEFQSTCNVTRCTTCAVSKLMDEIGIQSSDATSLKRLLNVKNTCLDLWHDPDMTRSYFNAEKKCISSIMSVPFEGNSKDYNLGDIAMTVVKMNTSTVNNGYVQISASKVLVNDPPVVTKIPTEPFLSASETHNTVSVVSYSGPAEQLFLANQSNVSLVSKVIRVEVAGRDINDLSNLLVINFTVNSSTAIPANYGLSCLFYDEKDNLPQPFKWSDYGSFTTLDYFNSSNIVMCSYNHMTPFAVLLGDLKIDEHNWIILSYISYIGCGLSLFFCTVSVFVYMLKRSPNVNHSSSIHVCLSGALLLLNTSYLLSEWAATLGKEGVCVFVAVAMEYSLLCCFFWMAIEAVHLYLLLVKVFNTYIRHYMTKLSLFGWGVPAVIVGVSLSVYDVLPLYGTKTISLSGTQGYSKICWITNSSFLYGMNLTCLSLMFVLNTTILTTVICQIVKLRHWDTKHTSLSFGKKICSVLGVTCLLGMTWGLGFLSYGYTNYPVLYLFCICNSLQGLSIFLWICITTRNSSDCEDEKLTVFKPWSFTSTSKSSIPDHSGHS
ncbi:adhesion G-protein coupled receptor G5-like isoform X2 [Brachyhypopomus gauderio]|uniref:adhesion G-protein coupled receptor G5-like isoform X2 n=1 Tax=Brachyhypopomus gauderio TaxID=698409 RepID=UPI004040FF27